MELAKFEQQVCSTKIVYANTLSLGTNNRKIENVTTLNSAHQSKKKKKRSSENLTVVGLSNNRAVYIASSKFFEPNRFVWHLNKVGGEYIQEQQPNKSHCYNQNMGFVD